MTDDVKGSEPAAKRRKLGPAGSQPAQSSFADVLERLKEETGDAPGTLSQIGLIRKWLKVV